MPAWACARTGKDAAAVDPNGWARTDTPPIARAHQSYAPQVEEHTGVFPYQIANEVLSGMTRRPVTAGTVQKLPRVISRDSATTTPANGLRGRTPLDRLADGNRARPEAALRLV